MDKITQSFLNEFVERNELSKLAPDKQFEQFAAYVTVRRHYNGETFDPGDIHTGGGGDIGIDAVAILVNGALVSDVDNLSDHDVSGHLDVTFIFVQADRGPSFDGKKISDMGFGVKDFFEANPKLVRNSRIQAFADVMEVLYNESAKFRPGNPICRLYYATTGTWSAQGDLEARRAQVEQDLRATQIFRDVEFVCLGAEQLQQLHRQSKNAVVREFAFAKRTLLPDINGVSEAYIGYVPFSEFLNIIQDDSGEILGSIFLENVRDWQEYTAPVNDEIRETVSSDHTDRFVVMNNGVTMIARSLRPIRGDRFQIEDFQIVNGCQTTNVLFDQKAEAGADIHIPLRLIATEDDDVIKAVIRGTNRQTRVEEDQFFALTDFAETLEDFFEAFPEPQRVYYERRSGQYARRHIHSTRIVTHRNLVKLVASIFLEIPHQAARRYSSLREMVGKDIFAKGDKLEPYYVSALSAYRLDVNFRTQRIDTKLRAARFHILLAMRYLANSDPKPLMNSREMESYCKVIMSALADASLADDLCNKAASIVEQEADRLFKRDAEGGFDRDDIRTQPFTEAVIARCKREMTLVA